MSHNEELHSLLPCYRCGAKAVIEYGTLAEIAGGCWSAYFIKCEKYDASNYKDLCLTCITVEVDLDLVVNTDAYLSNIWNTLQLAHIIR